MITKYYMREKLSKGFCVLPFFGIELPGDIRCCLLKRGYDLEQIRYDMLSGNRPDACSACWNLEDSGLLSDRQLKNSALDLYWDRDIRSIEDDCHQGKFHINHYKVGVSNACNAACVTCDSGSSSYWAKLLGDKTSFNMSIQELDEKIDYRKAISINFVGGETMMGSNNLHVLERLLEAGNDKCFIQLTTNGSLTPTVKQRKIMQQFKNLNIGISIDGIGPVFEYMRYPLKWSDLCSNIKIFREMTDNISITCTTSNVNVMYFPQMISWFDENDLRYHYNPVISPKHFRPSALPLHVKEMLLQRHGHIPSMRFFLEGSHKDSDDTDFLQMKEQLVLQDKIKKINIRDYLPEFCDLIDI